MTNREKRAIEIIKDAEIAISELYGRGVKLIEAPIEITKFEAQQIVDIVVSVTGVSIEKIMSKDRTLKIAAPRQLICYFLRQHCGMSLKDIGHYMRRDHTSVIHAIRLVKDMICVNDVKYAPLVSQIETALSK